MERKILWAGFLLLGILLILAAFISLGNKNRFKGIVISPAPLASGFSSLSDQSGRLVKLSDLRGKLVLVFFGYTNCPDECPATLAKLKQTISWLDDNAKHVVVIMVTTDPSRDTPAVLDSYLNNFNPDFLGLTGTVTNLEQTWKDYGVTVLDGSKTHSARIYVIDQSGKLRLTFPQGMIPADMVADLKILLGKQ